MKSKVELIKRKSIKRTNKMEIITFFKSKVKGVNVKTI